MEKIWSALLHFGTNMWNEEGNTRGRENNPDAVASSTLRFDKALFREVVEYGKTQGLNTVILDVAEGLKYESHPELAVKGSWTRDEMEKELEYLKGIGIEVIPKLNFSTGHDLWLGTYERMVSTPVYYKVVADLINEVCDVFKPRYFHLGMDEEDAGNQRNFNCCIIRQHDLWWHDLYYMIDCVEKNNARPWIWSDYMWHYPETFLEKCPKEVIQSNWYYGLAPNPDAQDEWSKGAYHRLNCFELLDKHGFDQVPTGSNWSTPENMEWLTKYSSDYISDNKLLGYMTAPWYMTIPTSRQRLFDSMDQLGEARKWFESK